VRKKGKERKGKERKGKERKGKERYKMSQVVIFHAIVEKPPVNGF